MTESRRLGHRFGKDVLPVPSSDKVDVHHNIAFSAGVCPASA